MNLLLLIETIKFHKMKKEMTVRVLFLCCFLANIGSYLIPGSDPDLSAMFLAYQALTEGQVIMPQLSRGNLIFFGGSFAAALITLLCVYIYAALFVGEREDKSTREIMIGFLRSLPTLAVCGLLLIVPVILSAFLMMIPLFIILAALYFLPLNLILGRQKLTTALAATVKDTNHMKLIIFLQFTMLMIIMNLPESLLTGLLPVNGLAAALIASFFISVKAMMRGRLMGLFYLNLVKKVPYVIPSKPRA
jgi:hypothetical protein